MILLNAEETAQALPYRELVPAIARTARELAAGVLNAPERLVVPVGANGALLAMPAVAPDIGITKLITVQPDNTARGLATIQGELIAFRTETGRRLLLADGPTVTARRTAAVTLLAIDTLQTRTPHSALLIGTGVQARAHAVALADYSRVRKFWIAGSTLQRAKTFIESLHAALPDAQMIPLACSDIDPESVDADVVIALTTSRTPVMPAHLPAATLAIGVGAFRPEMAELPATLLHRRRVVVDYLHGARFEAGDLLQAHVRWSEVIELSQLLGAKPTAEHDGFVFKSVGHASWDLAAARVVLQQLALSKAVELG